MRTAKEWNALPASVFPDQNNFDVFETKVNRPGMLHLRPYCHFTSGASKYLSISNKKKYKTPKKQSLNDFVTRKLDCPKCLLEREVNNH